MTENSRPLIVPKVAEELAAAVPGRIARKLAADPTAAEQWDWSGQADRWTIHAGAEQVTLRPENGVISRATEVGCTCLLSPRCRHVISVVRVLPLADQPPPQDPGSSAGESGSSAGESGSSAGESGRAATTAAVPDPGAAAAESAAESGVKSAADRPARAEPVALSARQRAAADRTWQAGATALAGGAKAADPVIQADLLRAAHACRAAGLHRLATSATRVVTSLRQLASDSPAFDTAGLAADLAGLLDVSGRLRGSARGDLADIGTARRSFAPLGQAALYGLCSEAVVTKSGYAGVVTYLRIGDRIVSSAEIKPATAHQAVEAYDSGTRFGSLALRHFELSRSHIAASGCTISEEGRLGAGSRVTAVRVGPSGWDADPLSGCWRDGLDEQLERVYRYAARPANERPVGWDLVFSDATVVGATERMVLATVPGRDLVCLAPLIAGSTLAYWENLRLLGTACGLELRMVAKVVLDRPRTLAPLAVAPVPGGDRWRCPDAWAGQVNLGFDQLTVDHLVHLIRGQDRPPIEQVAWSAPENPVEVLRRWLYRVALGGSATLGPVMADALARDAARLAGASMRTGGAILESLIEAGPAPWTVRSARGNPVFDRLAARWVAGMRYLMAAHAEAGRQTWVG